MVPYIGAVMAWLPAFVYCARVKTLGQFMLIAATLTTIHVWLSILWRHNWWAPCALERRGDHHCTALLAGYGEAWDWFGHSHYRGPARDLRSHRIVETDRALAQRLRS